MPRESFKSNNIIETKYIWKIVYFFQTDRKTDHAAQCNK